MRTYAVGQHAPEARAHEEAHKVGRVDCLRAPLLAAHQVELRDD